MMTLLEEIPVRIRNRDGPVGGEKWTKKEEEEYGGDSGDDAVEEEEGGRN
jgi:hypothetical protein